MQNSTIALIMAAGEGKRMKSALPKVLHTLCGKTMIQCVIDSLGDVCQKPVVIVGVGAEKIIETLGTDVDFAHQTEQKGTAHAVLMAKRFFENFDGNVLVVAGDMPLLRRETLCSLSHINFEQKNAATVLFAVSKDPTGYGRIVRDNFGNIKQIVEQKDATQTQLEICEINTSVYCFNSKALLFALNKITNNNAQGEYYLTDCIEILANAGEKIGSLQAQESECMGVNDKAQLSQATQICKSRINNQHLLNGVTIIDPQTTYIDFSVEIQSDVTIYPGNVIEGLTVIKTGSQIFPSNYIQSASIGEHCKIGPNAHLREKTVLKKNCRIGNFVELKNVTIDEGSKVSHLAYCGDGDIGKRVNVSCGVIFSNYDGKNKFKTTIKDDVFVGCNANLIAPVTLEKNSYIAAGSTITNNVESNALAIARSRQENKKNWVKK